MRLPKKLGRIDIGECSKMADMFLEKGFTYFDTAYVYNGGKSEEAAKKISGRTPPPRELHFGDQASRVGGA